MDVRTGRFVTVHWKLWTLFSASSVREFWGYRNGVPTLPQWLSWTVYQPKHAAWQGNFVPYVTDLITDSSSDTFSSKTLFALPDDIESVCLIRECLELEEHLNTNFTHSLLISSSNSELDKESRPFPRQLSKIKLQEMTSLLCLKSAAKMRTQDSLLTLRGWYPGWSCGTWL